MIARLRRCAEEQMEAWGYAALGLGIMIGLPAFLYHLSTTAPAPGDVERLTAAVQGVRVVNQRTDSDWDVYLELSLEGFAVPVRFHQPVVDPDDSGAPLNAAAFTAARPAAATVTIDRRERGKLKTPPSYPPDRWIEGYGLEAGGKVYLPAETGVEIWRKDRRGLRVAAYVTLFLEAGLLLFAAVWWWESGHAHARPEGPAPVLEAEPVDPSAARSASSFYYAFLPGLMLFNLAAMIFESFRGWDFGPGYWRFFAAGLAALQALFYLHHRRHLSIMDSTARRSGEAPGGFFSYLILTVLLCVMLTPALQFLYLRLVR